MFNSNESAIQEFKRVHHHPLNVWFHVVCAFVFIVALIRVLPITYHNFAIGIYSMGVYMWMGFDHWPLVLGLFIGLFLLNSAVNFTLNFIQFKRLIPIPLIVALIAYLAPELSHFATGERTVLDTWPSLGDVFANAALLLPLSLASI
jgi:hypothetical protein